MPKKEASERVSALAARQHGLVTRAQVLEAGLSRKAIEHRLVTGAWEIAEYRVYRIAGAPATWHQRLLAACLGGPAIASHRSAARLWDFPVDGDDGVIEVTAVRHRRRHSSGVVWHESQRLEERYVASVAGVALTTPVRTIVDLGAVLDVDALEEVFHSAMRMRLVTIEGTERTLEELGVRLGRKHVMEMLRRARSHARPLESPLETRFLQLIRAARLPCPVAQFEVRDVGNRLVARVDFAYPECMLVIELDGARWHSTERDRARDEARDARIVALGYRVARFTWREVRHHPDEVVARLRRELDL